MQAPTKQQTGWGFIKPLSWDVWLALGLTVLAFPMVALVLEFLSVKGDIERGEVLPGYTESAVSHLWRRCRAQAVRFVMRFCGTAWLACRSGSMRGRGSQAAPRCLAAGAPTSAPPRPLQTRAFWCMLLYEPFHLSSIGGRVAAFCYAFLALIVINTCVWDCFLGVCEGWTVGGERPAPGARAGCAAGTQRLADFAAGALARGPPRHTQAALLATLHRLRQLGGIPDCDYREQPDPVHQRECCHWTPPAAEPLPRCKEPGTAPTASRARCSLAGRPASAASLPIAGPARQGGGLGDRLPLTPAQHVGGGGRGNAARAGAALAPQPCATLRAASRAAGHTMGALAATKCSSDSPFTHVCAFQVRHLRSRRLQKPPGVWRSAPHPLSLPAGAALPPPTCCL